MYWASESINFWGQTTPNESKTLCQMIPTDKNDGLFTGKESADRIIHKFGKKKKKSPPSNLKGFSLVQYKCRKKKAAYDRCYRQNHSSFLSGKKEEDDGCEILFEAYRECVLLGMKKDREKRGLSPPNVESVLGEFE